jgi:hypothetical protein
MQKWKVGLKDAQLLLGGITNRRFNQLSVRPSEPRALAPSTIHSTSFFPIVKQKSGHSIFAGVGCSATGNH